MGGINPVPSDAREIGFSLLRDGRDEDGVIGADDVDSC